MLENVTQAIVVYYMFTDVSFI